MQIDIFVFNIKSQPPKKTKIIKKKLWGDGKEKFAFQVVACSHLKEESFTTLNSIVGWLSFQYM